jgi:peptidoglycan/LPS O-acetylase OafA/YrhL
MKNLQLEGLRGLASLWVFGGHLFVWQSFYPGGIVLNQFVANWLIAINPGHLGVLFFFILSGYVIGIAYPHDKRFFWRKYLLKRWIRIYPMYVLAIILSCIIVPASSWQILGHLLFLNPNFCLPLSGNTPLWSISYEFGFYLILPLIFRIRFSPRDNAILLLVATILVRLFSWLNGLSFWLIGLIIAWKTQNKRNVSSTIPIRQDILAGIFIAAALNCTMKSFIAILKVLGIPNPSPILSFTPTIGDLLYLPSILFVFLKLIDVKVPKYVELGLFLFPFLQISIVISGSLIKGPFWILPEYSSAMLLACVAIVFKIKPVNFDLATLAPIGAISYGIYIYHMPMTHLLGKVPLFGGGWIEWFIRLAMTILLVLSFAYLTEIKLQPKIRDFFLKYS